MPKQTQDSVEFAHADQKIEDEMRVVRNVGFKINVTALILLKVSPYFQKFRDALA